MPSISSRPGIYVQETGQFSQTIQGAETGVGLMYGVTARGPIGRPVELLSHDDFKQVFGPAVENESAFYEVKDFFDEAGGGGKLWFVRLAHYDDITDATAVSGDTAQVALDTTTKDGPAQVVGSTAFSGLSLVVDAGSIQVQESLDFDINGQSFTADFTGLPAQLTAASGSFTPTLPSDVSFVYRVNDGAERTIDLSGQTVTDAEGAASLINSSLYHSACRVAGGVLEITTDQKGSGAKFEIVSVGANTAAELGLTPTVETGSGSVTDVSDIPFSEVKSVLESDVSDSVAGDVVAVTQTNDGKIVLTVTDMSQPYGPNHSIEITGGSSDLITAFGLQAINGSPATGTASSVETAVTFYAGYKGDKSVGVDGNKLSVDVTSAPVLESKGTGNDLAQDASVADDEIKLTSLVGVRAETQLVISDGANEEVVTVESADSSVVGGSVEHTVTLTSALTNPYVAANSTVRSVEYDVDVYYNESLVEQFEAVSVNPFSPRHIVTTVNDENEGSLYVMVEQDSTRQIANTAGPQPLTNGTSELVGMSVSDILGDETAGTGLYAGGGAVTASDVAIAFSLDTVTPSIPVSAVVLAGLSSYASRQKLMPFFVAPKDRNRSQCVSFVQNDLGIDSSFAAIIGPWKYTSDPEGRGSQPKKLIPGVGRMLGICARVDGLKDPQGQRNGGPATSPAGTGVYGECYSDIGLERTFDDTDHDRLNAVGFNVIRNYPNGGQATFEVSGTRTLSSEPKYKFISTRRYLNYLHRTLKKELRWAVFRDNDFRLWGQVTQRLEDFFRAERKASQLDGRSDEEAFSVVFNETTTTPQDVDAGLMNGRIYVNLKKPAEKIIIDLSQDRSTGEVTLTAV